MTADNVTAEQAEQIAAQFMNSHRPSVRKPLQMAKRQPLNLKIASDATAYYVFNVGTENGYVIVSGSNLAPQVLAFSGEGSFKEETIPTNMKTWLDGYADQIAYLENTKGKHEAPRQHIQRSAVDPLLTSTWGQGAPYNSMCPTDPSTGIRCVTGCVATALAQVINYHKYPSQTIAAIPSYTTETLGISMPQISITTIDWDNMLDSYSGSSTTTQKNAVAQLMLLCGQSTEMNYNISSAGGSGADMALDAKALQTYFGYDKTVRVLDRNAFSTVAWESLVYDELAAGRPVLYGGQSTGGGHAFVVDGYDGNGLFHINWGWDGNSDSYFLLSVLNPYNNEAIGSSSSDDGFSFGQNAVVGIQHGSDDIIPERFTIYGITNTGNTSYTRTSSSANFTGINVQVKGYNMSSDTHNFVLNLALVNTDEEIITTISTDVEAEKNYLYGWGALNFSSCSFGAYLTDGEYYIMPVSRSENSTEWEPCWRSNVYRIKATINGNTLTLTEPSISLSTTIQVTGNTNVLETLPLTAQITNNGSYFNDYVYLAVNGYIVGGRMFEAKTGETANFDIDFMPTSTGSQSLLLAYKTDNGYVAFAAGEVTVTGDLDCSITINNATGGMVQEDRVSATVNITSTHSDYDDDVVLRLFKYDASSGSYNYVDLQTRHLTLANGESTALDFEFNGLVNGGNYVLSLMYYKSGELVTDTDASFTVRMLSDGDLFTATTPEGVEMVFKVISAVGKTCQAGSGEISVVTTEGGDASNSSNRTPYDTYWKYSTTQMLYTPQEVGVSGTITGLAFNVLNATSCSTTELKIYLGHKSGTFSSTSNYVSSSNLTLVYSGTPTLGTTTGWERVNFNQNTFTYNGTDNLVIVVTRKSSDYKTDLKYASFTGSGYILERGSDSSTTYGDVSNTSNYIATITARPSIKFFVTTLFKAVSTATQGNVTIPDVANGYKVIGIGYKAFQNCTGMTGVSIPRAVSTIGNYAFGGCIGLTNVITKIRNPFTIASSVFNGVYGQATLYVPYGRTAKYESISAWNQFSNILENNPENGDIFTAPTIEGIEMSFQVKSAADRTCEVMEGSASGTLEIDADASNTATNAPYGNYYHYSTTQMLYTSSEIGRSGKISSIAFNVSTAASLATSEVKVYLGHKPSTFSSENDYVSSGNLTLVYSGSPTIGQSAGWEPIIFNKGEFTYNGTDNLVVVVTKKSNSYTNTLKYSCSSHSGYVLYRQNDNTSSYADVTNTSNAYNTSSYRPSIQIFIDSSVTAIPTDTQNEVTIPTTAKGFTVIGIGEYAFNGCNGITDVYIPRGVTSIGDNAFDGCDNLTTVTADIKTPLPIVPATFSNRANAMLRVPVGYVPQYQAAEVWNEFQWIVEIAPLEITLVDGTDYSNSRDKRCDVLNYSRTFGNTFWQAWYVPFDVTLTSDLLEHFAFAKFAGTYTEEDGTFCITVVRMKEGDLVKANTPYCVQAKVADSTTPQVITQTDAILKTAAENSFYVLSAEKKITFFGNYTNRDVTEEDQNLYALSGGKYRPQIPGFTLKPFRCFFSIEDREDNPYVSAPNPSEVKLMLLGDDDETGIIEITESSDSEVYDLSGRKMVNSKLSNGIYIINGKKVIVK